MALITAAGALAGQALGRDWLAVVGVLVVVAILVTTKAFGYSELVLIARRASHFALSMIEPAPRADDVSRHKAVRLQGSREWELVWTQLVEFAEREGLSKLHMDLNAPWLEEGFHGSWYRGRMPDRLERWTTGLPIIAGGKIAGRIDAIGPIVDESSLLSLSKLVELIEDVTPQIEQLMTVEIDMQADVVAEQGEVAGIQEEVVANFGK
ncbi:MAG: hypothetical protein KDB03_00745 [Planctomycetales bacterium]|nr:hypothetical protein [Planctomycetales bacterium]